MRLLKFLFFGELISVFLMFSTLYFTKLFLIVWIYYSIISLGIAVILVGIGELKHPKPFLNIEEREEL